MKRIIAVFVFSFVAFPAVSTAAEPAWWTQQKRQCGLSPSLAYNSWDGKCNSGGSSGGGSAGATIGGELGNLIGKEIGKELNKALWGDPEAAARRRAEEELRTQEQRRASEEARLRAAEAEAARRRAEQEVLRKHEEMKNRLLGGMMGVEGSPSLGLMGVESRPSKLSLMTDSDSPLKVTETRGAFGSTEVTPAGIGSPPAKQGLQLMLDGDAMVVDARNVPSGLPKSVDEAIPRTPSGDRVRKGFEAIQAGDWKVALAWFQDARNKEPGNPGLGRLVDLAQFTLEYRAQAKTLPNSAPVKTTQLSKQNSTINSTGAAAVKSGDPAIEPGDNSVARAVAGQMAARARADAAFEQYVKKYGDHYSDARTRAVSKAYRGEGYTDEELKAQLQKSLIDYRTNYRKNHPKGPAESVGGSPAVEEILIGGRG